MYRDREEKLKEGQRRGTKEEGQWKDRTVEGQDSGRTGQWKDRT